MVSAAGESNIFLNGHKENIIKMNFCTFQISSSPQDPGETTDTILLAETNERGKERELEERGQGNGEKRMERRKNIVQTDETCLRITFMGTWLTNY